VGTLRSARERIGKLGVVSRTSALYRTPAWGVTDQPDFINAALALETELEPYALLAALKAIEQELGRVATFRWGPRAIDLDILAYEGVELHDPELTIPHARLDERAFALIPLAEIEPSYAAARDALALEERAAVERVGPFEGEGGAR